MLSEMVDEVTREMFLSEAVAFLQEDEVDQTEAQAVRAAVLKRVEFLDSTFLAALTGFVRAASAAGDGPLAQLLLAIRSEVLLQVSRRLPGAVRALDLALLEADKEQRVAVLRTVLAGGLGEVPGADADSLAATASQFIDEMEEQEQVLDRRLLARLCLLREELRMLREEDVFSAPAAGREFVRANVPQRCAAFLKELVTVADPMRRVSLLDKALRDDWEGAAPRGPTAALEGSPHQGQPDYVRPGRFLATLNSTARHLEETSGGDGAANAAAVLQRLEQIRGEAMAVLDRVQAEEEGGGGGAAARARAGAGEGAGGRQAAPAGR